MRPGRLVRRRYQWVHRDIGLSWMAIATGSLASRIGDIRSVRRTGTARPAHANLAKARREPQFQSHGLISIEAHFPALQLQLPLNFHCDDVLDRGC